LENQDKVKSLDLKPAQLVVDFCESDTNDNEIDIVNAI